MKKVILSLFFVLALKGLALAQGHFVIMPHGSNRCYAISSDPHMMADSVAACKGNTMYYSVVGENIENYHFSWLVEGGVVESYSSDSVTVLIRWGEADDGYIYLTGTNGRHSRTVSINVHLIDKPVVSSSSVPDYSVVLDGGKKIRVCAEDLIVLTDCSVSESSEITDYYWECEGVVSNGRVFEYRPYGEGVFSIIHRVYNACGCYDEEIIEIEVAAHCQLEMNCYGTVCGGSERTYTLISPSCSTYIWSVENGIIISGQGSDKLTVKWGNPESGYGVITLDGSSCNCDCKARKSIRVPIISNGVGIDGPDTVCVGTENLFRLPMYGSTNYTWTVEPAASVIVSGNLPNERFVIFPTPGTYTLKAEYNCPFLHCSGMSDVHTVEVLGSLQVLPQSAKICQGETFSCTTDSHIPVHWTVMLGGAEVFDTVGVTMTRRFVSAGTYIIRATSDRFCNTAECRLIVNGKPAAPTALDVPSTACPNTAVRLSGRPSSGCYLEWRSAWGGTQPNQVEGDTVSIAFGDTLATLLVFQVNAETGCRSDSTVLHFNEFTLAQLYVDTLRVCQGQRVNIGVSDQSADGVLYNWWVKDPELASIGGDNTNNAISLIGNYTGNQLPYRTMLYLHRTSCLGDRIDAVVLLVGETSPPMLYYEPHQPCQYSSVVVKMDIEHENAASARECVWIGNDTATGGSYNTAYGTSGQHLVRLHYVSRYGCRPVDAQIYVDVNPVPASYLDIESNPGYICMMFSDNVTGTIQYSWNTGATTQCIPYDENNTYTCTATFSDYVCSSSAMLGPDTSESACVETIQFEETELSSNVVCFNEVRFARTSTIPRDVNELVVVNGLSGRSQELSLSNSSETLLVDSVGPYTAIMKWKLDDICYRAVTSGVVYTIPRLSIRYNCQDSLIITDSSMYYEMAGFKTITVRKEDNTIVYTATIPFSTQTIRVPSVGLAEGENLSVTFAVDHCRRVFNYTFHNGPRNVSITARSRMCNQTPFLFSGDAEGVGLVYEWTFDDQSYNYGQDMWHVFRENSQSFLVELDVTDYQGCIGHSNISILTRDNPFEVSGIRNYKLEYDNTDYPVCSGERVKLVYNTEFNSSNHLAGTKYAWTPQGNTTFCDNSYADHSGPYLVFATDTTFQCRGADRKDLKFNNTPTARIGQKSIYCEGETVRLTGNTGAQYGYEWKVISPSQTEYSYNTPNISFEADETGTWTVDLTVTAPQGMGGCSANSSSTFEVASPPVPPNLVFFDNECIGDGPVSVSCVENDNLVWSNGSYGNVALYYYDGPASAYRVDPVTGCRSSSSLIVIPSAPRFDALLTGCYYVCDDETDVQYLEVQTLEADVANWTWLGNDVVVDQGTTFPAALTVAPTNTYTMTAEYGNSCEASSPIFSIIGTNCDEVQSQFIEIDFEDYKLELEECRIVGTFVFSIINNSETDLLLNDVRFVPNQSVLNFGPVNLTIPAQSVSPLISVYMEITDFSQPIILLVLGDGAATWKTYPINILEWLEQQNLHSGCNFASSFTIAYVPSQGTTGHSVFYDLDFQPFVANAMMMWSDECEVVSQSYDPLLNRMTGRLFFDYGKLSQLYYADSCVHLHLLVCDEDKLCIADTCIEIDGLMDGVPTPDYQQKAETSGRMEFNMSDTRYVLMPNPATRQVMVIDAVSRNAANDIVEVDVFALDGRLMLTENGKAVFDVGSLPKAAYIVKIVAKDGKKEYVKLIKK